MKKKRNWFSAMKICCITPPKKKPNNVSDNRGKKEKKGVGKLTQIKSNSFIPIFKEPSSIEKIFSDFEKERENVESRPPILSEEGSVPPPVLPLIAASPVVTSPRVSSIEVASPKISSPKAASPIVSRPRIILPQHEEISDRPEPTQINYHASATKIQAIYRGHMARRSFRALKGLVRLQGVVSGQNAKRQTVNAMKQMQRVVRVQSQIQSLRVQVIENQSQHQDQYKNKNDKEVQSSFSRWSQRSEAGDHKNWDESSVTKKERDAMMQRKAEAIIRRERAMLYAYSRESWKDTPKSTQETANNYRSAGDLRWCNWLERQLALQTQKNFSPQKSETVTPKSLKSTDAKPELTPPPLRSSPAKSFSNMSGFSRQRPRGGESLFDDADSLVSCPPFTGPHYMSPTMSFKAKERAPIYQRERSVGTPRSECNRRLSYPFTPVSRFAKASSTRNKILDDNQSVHSIDNSSVASLVSLSASVGRRPFNRFV